MIAQPPDRSVTGTAELRFAVARRARKHASWRSFLAFGAAAAIAGCSGGGSAGSPQVPIVAAPSVAQAPAAAAADPLASSGPFVAQLSTATAPAQSTLSLASTTGTQAFADDFQSDRVGAAAARWTPASGTWSVCLPPGATQAYCQTASAGIAQPVVAGAASWTDYEVEATVERATVTSSNSGLALLGRVVDLTHFYQLELRNDVAGSGRQFWYIWKFDGQTWTELAGGPLAIAANQAYHLRLQFAGTHISAYEALDSASTLVALGSATDASYPAGGVAIRSWNTKTVSFDNVQVRLNTVASSATATPKPSAAPSGAPIATAPTATPAPTSAPTGAPTSAPATGVATYAGCPMFPAGDWYNADVSNAPVDPNGATQLSQSNTAARNQNFVFSFGIERLNLATNATPTHTVVAPPGSTYYHAAEFSGVPFPWQNGYYIEGSVQAGGGGGGDNHGLTLNTDTCTLYETYWTSWNGSTLGAYSGGHWDLKSPFVGFAPSAMASGLSLFEGAIKWDYELANGSIDHALNFFIPQYSNGPGVSPPAVSSGSNGPSGIPYGAHLRLHASYPETGTSQMIAVIRALKKYGMYLADTSSQSGQEGFYTITPSDGNNGHYNFGGSSSFKLTDFDVIPSSVK